MATETLCIIQNLEIEFFQMFMWLSSHFLSHEWTLLTEVFEDLKGQENIKTSSPYLMSVNAVPNSNTYFLSSMKLFQGKTVILYFEDVATTK